MTLETWRLHHPEIGLIEFEIGADEDFRAAYSEWPDRPAEATTLSEKLQVAGESKQLGKGLSARPSKIFHRVITNLRKSAQVKVNGQPIRRYHEIRAVRIPLTKHLGKNLAGMSGPVDRLKPNLKIQKGLFGDVQVVTFHQAGQVVELEPPPGSRGEAYYEAVQSSDFKRTVLPIVSGLGKGGWALAVLVLGPLMGRLIDWLLSYLPDFDLPSLPPLPSIELPLPSFPTIDLPVLQLPEFNLPELPEWVVFIMSYTRIWMPILIGIALGIMALRNSKKSDAQKSQWEQAKKRPSEVASPAGISHGADKSLDSGSPNSASVDTPPRYNRSSSS